MRETEFVLLGRVSATALAEILLAHPTVLKPLLSVCNLAGRALARDIGIKNLDTYAPRLDAKQAAAIAGYIKPFLPPAVSIHALSEIDRVEWIDKEIRRIKGSWENLIVEALCRLSGVGFAKRKFTAGGEEFEIDAQVHAQGLWKSPWTSSGSSHPGTSTSEPMKSSIRRHGSGRPTGRQVRCGHLLPVC